MTDDDDRMERAKRIRRMREGRRDESAEADDESTDEPPSESEWFEDETTDDATEMNAHDSTPTSESATDDERDDTTGQADASGEPDATDDDDAAAAASSAAAAAAAFEGEDTSTVETGTTDADESHTDDSADSSRPDRSETASEEPDTPAEIEGPAATQPAEPEAETEIRVLEFRLGDEQYCLNIQHVEEIVKEEAITRVPNTPDHVRGVVDLRGQITTILDPKVSLGIDEIDEEQLIIVFDAETFEDQGHTGWVVDEVRQVMPIKESEVKDSPLDQQAVNGVIERDGEFVIWTEPEVALLED